MSILRHNLDIMYKREISHYLNKVSKSVLLLGPRQTGKSTVIQSLKPDITINLANESTFLKFASDSSLLENILSAKKVRHIFIDEVQRIPGILNTIQAILDENTAKYKFYLTGSSARKLKRGNANLLPGRIIAFNMYPLTFEEMGKDFNLNEALSTGTLPGVYSMKDVSEKKLILSTYGATYLKEEIQAEALTKNIEGFSRFLFVIASKNAEFIDYAKLGANSAITQKTATRFFQILEDTLVVHRLNAYAKSDFRRLVQHPKFYFFDTGVLNSLLGNYKVSEDRKGILFETFIVNQIKAWSMSHAIDLRLSTFRTEGGSEIDVIIESEGKVIALEIKNSKNIGKKDLRSFETFSTYYKKKFESMVIYTGTLTQKIEGVTIYPVELGLQKIANYFL